MLSRGKNRNFQKSSGTVGNNFYRIGYRGYIRDLSMPRLIGVFPAASPLLGRAQKDGAADEKCIKSAGFSAHECTRKKGGCIDSPAVLDRPLRREFRRLTCTNARLSESHAGQSVPLFSTINRSLKQQTEATSRRRMNRAAFARRRRSTPPPNSTRHVHTEAEAN
jgi:hypothetical protein